MGDPYGLRPGFVLVHHVFVLCYASRSDKAPTRLYAGSVAL